MDFEDNTVFGHINHACFLFGGTVSEIFFTSSDIVFSFFVSRHPVATYVNYCKSVPIGSPFSTFKRFPGLLAS